MPQRSGQQAANAAVHQGLRPDGSLALGRDQTRTVFGQVMGLVAATVAFTALGPYIGRNLTGGAGILFFIAGFACIFGLQFATARGREQLAIGLLFGLGLALGLAVTPGPERVRQGRPGGPVAGGGRHRGDRRRAGRDRLRHAA